MHTATFEIVPPIESPEEAVFVTGSVPALGNWDPAQALRLNWKAPVHCGLIEVEPGTAFEYKVTRGSWETEAVDAYGDVPLNSRHEAWTNAKVRRTVADWKDRYCGRLTTDRIYSQTLASPRELLIWLPPGYAADSGRRFPVLYLHDGDNVFDPETSPLSKTDWAVDEWLRVLVREGAMPEMMAVAVRHPEGFCDGATSCRDMDLSPLLGGTAYAFFVATELAPFIDLHYRTLAAPEARMVAGGGLGGLSTFHLAMNHSQVFSRYACLSTSFEDVSQSLPEHAEALRTLEARERLPEGVRMYFDYGTHGLDECYGPYHRHLGELLRAKGWQDGKEFTIVRAEGGSHDELSWRLRFGDAIRFLAGCQ